MLNLLCQYDYILQNIFSNPNTDTIIKDLMLGKKTNNEIWKLLWEVTNFWKDKDPKCEKPIYFFSKVVILCYHDFIQSDIKISTS